MSAKAVHTAPDVVRALAGVDIYDTIDSTAGKRVCVLCFATVRRDLINQRADVPVHSHTCPWRQAHEWVRAHPRKDTP